MSDTATSTATLPSRARSRRALPRTPRLSLAALRRLPELGGLMLLAAVLNLWALSQNGYANDYYSAAVRSMSTSWHDFLFNSFDSSGVMTVDKPPLALWVQALSVRVFGYHPLSMLVPQALMGVASVALVYDLTRRLWGRTAGFAAGLVLALTPISVAISRHNNPDALLILCCVGALWAAVRAFEDGRTRWLVVSGALVGLGFETKMAVALMVVPGIAAAWLWLAPRGRPAALRQLLAGGAAMVATACAWPVLVWLTPAASRPWISGTSDNSIWSLITGYNGVGRLDGQAGGPGGMGGPGGGGPGGGGGGGPFGGPAGTLRLLDQSLGGQAGWLLGFALVSLVALALLTRLRRSDARTGWVIATGGAFLCCLVAFSFAKGIFHPYYVSLLAPFTAALVGAGVGRMAAGDDWARLAAPLAVAAGVVTELVVLDREDTMSWLAPVLVAGGVAAVFGLAFAGRGRLRIAVLAAALGLLLVAPGTWAAQTLGHATQGTFPAGGPESAGMGSGAPGGGPGGMGRRGGFGPPSGARGFMPPGGGFRAGGVRAGGGGPFGGNSAQLTKVLRYTRAHGGGTVAVDSQQGASGSIIRNGSDVAALGGFSGRESTVSVKWLARAVREGRIRWVLTSSSGGPGGGGGRMPGDRRQGSSAALSAVAKTCRKVGGQSGLYDCKGYASALAARG